MTEVSFADEEFGSVSLGDLRRKKRLFEMANQAALTPGGSLTRVFQTTAGREAAYRFVENDSIDSTEIPRAAAVAGFRRAKKNNSPYVFVPIDGSSLSLPSVPDDSEMGPIGNRWSKSLGVHVMNSIIVDIEGVTLGVAGQVYWTRERQEQLSRTKAYLKKEKTKRVRKNTQRPLEEKESAHWLTVMDQSIQAAKEGQFGGTLWFQLDAGADFSHMLATASLLESWVTVRSKNPRSLFEEQGTLLEKVLAEAPLGTFKIDVPQTPIRVGRTATIELRYVSVLLKLKPRGDGGIIPTPFFAVHAHEISKVPKGQEPIDWLLLTNKSGQTFEDAKEVVRAYSMRWRIEEVHKTWKSVTKVEESALTTLNGLTIWAAILFSVAVRIERLKYFSRIQPEAPASVELTATEIETLQLLRKAHVPSSRKQLPHPVLTIATAVRWIADFGGYMNPHKGPPGSIILARGLRYLRSAVDTKELLKM